MICVWVLLIFVSIMMKKWLPAKKHTHIKARVQKQYPIRDQSGQNQLK